MTFNFDMPFTELTGGIHVHTYQDPDTDPNSVLEINEPWTVKPHWWIKGPGFQDLAGTWHLKIIVESMGAGVEKTLLEQDYPFTVTGDYQPTIVIPSRLMDPNHSIPDDGAYKLVLLLTYTNVFGRHGRMAGFAEGPILQFYHFES